MWRQARPVLRIALHSAARQTLRSACRAAARPGSARPRRARSQRRARLARAIALRKPAGARTLSFFRSLPLFLLNHTNSVR